MILARAVVRVIAFLLLLALALVGLAVAVAAVDLGTVTDQAKTPELRDSVGRWFSAMESDGPIAVASALAGIGAVLLGLLLLAGLLVPRRERLVLLEKSTQGPLHARRRPLAQIAGVLTDRVDGVASTHAKVRARRRGGGRLQIRADRPQTSEAKATKQAISSQLEQLTGPFKLTARVQTRSGKRGKRVQ